MNVIEVLDKSHELDDVQNERLRLQGKWVELEHKLWRANLPADYQPLSPHPQKLPLRLTPDELWRLKQEHWDAYLKFLNLGIREHELRFGADGVPEWLIERRDQHRANVPKR